jgi:hypothetical protein
MRLTCTLIFPGSKTHSPGGGLRRTPGNVFSNQKDGVSIDA